MTRQRISRYEVLRRLGSGGMGEVYLARDTELDRPVALKVMSVELAKDPNQRKRFRSEAKAASGLVHPNICVIHEVGETEDRRPFLAMEYVQGQTLDQVLLQRRLKIREVLALGVQVADALDAAHARHIVHRDIKPANVMLDHRGHAKVLDFGLAKRFAEDGLSATTSLPHTRTGMLIGTPHYMSPEQVLGRDLDPRSDIFSLGAVLYECIVGQKPFLGNTVGETINNVVNQHPEPLGLENPLYSPALDRIVFKCLEKDPSQRYASAKELAEDLTRLMAEVEKASAAVKTVPGAAASAAEPEAEEEPCVSRSTHRFTVAAIAAVAALVVVVAGVLVAVVLSSQRRAAGDKKTALAGVQQSSVAVLPFDNFSGDPETDYLTDGLTEEITTALSRIRGLKVASRNSAFTFKGRKEDLRKVGQDLKVSALLEGSIRKAGNQIRVSAQLINAADGFHLWSETYDRAVDDIFTVQEEIARCIAEKLQGKNAPAPEARRSVDPQAHKLYLQGRLFWNKRTEPGLRKALQLFNEALEKDPTYPDAHAAIAASYYLLPIHAKDAKRSEYYKRAQAASKRALELDPRCAEAHAVLASLQMESGDNKGAEEHFRLAIELAPNYATAHHWYGRFLNYMDRTDDGLTELQKANDLDPLSPVIRTTIPEYYYLRGDYDRAISEARQVIEAFPDFMLARSMLMVALIQKGAYAEALGEMDKARALSPGDKPQQEELRGYLLARMGRTSEAREILAQLEKDLQVGEHREGQIACIYVALKEYQKALDYMEQAAKQDMVDPWVEKEPMFQELRDNPRFKALIREARLQKNQP